MALEDPSLYGIPWPPPAFLGQPIDPATGNVLSTIMEDPNAPAPPIPPPAPPAPPPAQGSHPGLSSPGTLANANYPAPPGKLLRIGEQPPATGGELAAPTLPPPSEDVAPPQVGTFEPEYVGQGPPPPGFAASLPISAQPGAPAEGTTSASNAPPPPAGTSSSAETPPYVDTITGGEQPRHDQYLDAIDATPQGVPIEPANMSPEENDAEIAKRHADESPEEYAARVSQFEQAKRNDLTAGLLRASQQRKEQAQRDYDAYMAAQKQAAADRAQIEIDAKKVATEDPARWMNKSTYNAVSGIVAATLGGLAQMQNGGRNLGLEQLNKYIENDNAAQKFNIQGQRDELARRSNAVNANLQSATEIAHAGEVNRNAVYEAMVGELQTKAQNFNPHGQTRLEIEGKIRQIRAAQATQNDAYQQQNQKNRIENDKSRADTYKAFTGGEKDLAEARKSDSETAKNLAKAAGMGAGVGSVVGTFKSLDDVPLKERDKAFRLPTKNGVPGGWIISNSTDNAKDATHLVGMYNQLDHDLNEMQRISVEREGAKSAGGTLWDKWRTNGEQHYRQLVTDAANTYGMMIHGRAPTSGVLEEVLKDIPELKAAWERGDTTELINDMRNDVDNRMSQRLQDYGANTKITSDRYKPADAPNANTLAAPLVDKPVKGDGGYARFDVHNADQQLDAIAQHYVQNPSLGGQHALDEAFERADTAQHQAVATISGDIAKLQAKKARSAAENAQLSQNKKALADRQEAIKAIDDAKARHADAFGRAKSQALWDEVNNKAETDRESAYDPGF